MQFTKILFPVDFSERSRAIAPHVRAVAARFQASLTLLHLVEIPGITYGTPEAPVMFEYPLEEIRESAENKLNLFADTEFPGLPDVHVLVDQGDPGSCIAELARLRGADLIMLPTRGRGRFRAALLGSVTAKTLHDAACPVWTAGHCEEMHNQHTEWKSVVCAVDTVPESIRLIRAADELAASQGSSVCLVHAVPVAEAGAERYFDLEFAAFLEDQAREIIARMQKEAGTNFDVCVKAMNIPAAVRQEADVHKADLVLIGRGALPHFAGRLRSHAYAIVRDMPCPVLSI
jgi:nucleotide-binding universal stress UspA family protein